MARVHEQLEEPARLRGHVNAELEGQLALLEPALLSLRLELEPGGQEPNDLAIAGLDRVGTCLWTTGGTLSDRRGAMPSRRALLHQT